MSDTLYRPALQFIRKHHHPPSHHKPFGMLPVLPPPLIEPIDESNPSQSESSYSNADQTRIHQRQPQQQQLAEHTTGCSSPRATITATSSKAPSLKPSTRKPSIQTIHKGRTKVIILSDPKAATSSATTLAQQSSKRSTIPSQQRITINNNANANRKDVLESPNLSDEHINDHEGSKQLSKTEQLLGMYLVNQSKESTKNRLATIQSCTSADDRTNDHQPQSRCMTYGAQQSSSTGNTTNKLASRRNISPSSGVVLAHDFGQRKAKSTQRQSSILRERQQRETKQQQHLQYQKQPQYRHHQQQQQQHFNQAQQCDQAPVNLYAISPDSMQSHTHRSSAVQLQMKMSSKMDSNSIYHFQTMKEQQAQSAFEPLPLLQLSSRQKQQKQQLYFEDPPQQQLDQHEDHQVQNSYYMPTEHSPPNWQQHAFMQNREKGNLHVLQTSLVRLRKQQQVSPLSRIPLARIAAAKNENNRNMNSSFSSRVVAQNTSDSTSASSTLTTTNTQGLLHILSSTNNKQFNRSNRLNYLAATTRTTNESQILSSSTEFTNRQQASEKEEENESNNMLYEVAPSESMNASNAMKKQWNVLAQQKQQQQQLQFPYRFNVKGNILSSERLQYIQEKQERRRVQARHEAISASDNEQQEGILPQTIEEEATKQSDQDIIDFLIPLRESQSTPLILEKQQTQKQGTRLDRILLMRMNAEIEISDSHTFCCDDKNNNNGAVVDELLRKGLLPDFSIDDQFVEGKVTLLPFHGGDKIKENATEIASRMSNPIEEPMESIRNSFDGRFQQLKSSQLMLEQMRKYASD